MHYIRGTKKWRRKVVSLLLIGSLIVGVSQTDVKISAHSDEERTYEDGVYIGSGTGFKSGTTTVKVTVKDDKIVSVEEVSTEDTKSYFQRAKVIMNQIVEKNSLDVDTVSGATYSCNGILRATKDALNQAKINKNGDIFAKGDGTKENPFVISNDTQLQNFAKTVDDGKSYKDQFIVLNNDINLEKKEWNPIGTEDKTGADSGFFAGNFDGKGHCITNLTLKTAATNEQNVGLFSTLGKYAEVRNVNLKAVLMEVNGDGVLRVGGIAGDTESGKKYKDAPIIENCSVEGTFHVETTGAALSFAGGIAGRAGANVAFLNNGTDVEIYNASKGGNNSAYAGGIVGTTGQKTVIANCYSFGQMTAISPKSTNYGGMAGGLAAMFAGVHLNSYANANVTIGNESSVHKWIGALYGQVTQVVKKDTSKYGYYNADTVQKVNGVTEAAIQAVGTSSSVKVGEIEEIAGKTVQEISSQEFAQILNKNIPSSEEILSQIGVREQKLKLWEVKNNKIVHGEKYYDDVTINTKIFEKGDGTKENPFVIDTEKQLRNFANSLTEDIDYQGLYISLGDDITLSSEKWIPIGNHEYSFEGYFDGQNHVVSGMAIGTKEEPHNIKNGEVYNGFFSVLGEHAYVKNLHLTNMSINVQYEASSYAGGITGYMNKGGIVDGCSVTGRISNHAKKGNNFAGGIAGYVYKGKIINSYTNVDVSVVTESGNIAEAGGLAALVNRGLVANCYTFGDAYGSADRQQEGMACVSSLVAVNAGTLVNCYAMGNNVTDDYSYYTGIVSGWITGIGKSYQCYYNKDSIMKIGSQIPNPIAVVGTVVSAGVNEEGDAYIGGLSAYHKGMTIEEMQGETLANELNKNFDNFTVDVEVFGLNANALRSWYYDKNKNQVVLSDKNSVAKYVRPEVEIVPEKNISYVDGIYYGRDKNKQYVVKVQVEQTKVVTISAIQGNVATCDAIFDEVLKKQKVSGTSALELALEEALSKAELGDDTDYEVLDPSKFAGGLGTKESPYLISNEEELRYLASSVNADVNYKNVYFALVCDITLTKEWKPIGRAFDGGNAYPFEGQFDGRGHVIRNLTIGTEAMPAAMMTTGLFGFTNGEADNNEITYGVNIKNVHLRDVNVYNVTKGKNYCGTLLGTGQNGIYLDHCSVTGKIKTVTEDSFNRVGGLTGSVLRGTITNCWTNVMVDGSTNVSTTYAGGLVALPNRVSMLNCYTLGDVVANASHNNKVAVGGLCGQQGGIAINCYATGNITSQIPTTDIGALFGRTAGIGVNEYCYYNKDAKLINGSDVVQCVSSSGIVVNDALESKTEGLSLENMRTDEFAKILNKNVSSMGETTAAVKEHLAGLSLKHTMYYDNETLSTWGVRSEIVTFDNVNTSAAPQETKLPATNSPEKTKAPSNPQNTGNAGNSNGYVIPGNENNETTTSIPAITETPKAIINPTSTPVATDVLQYTSAPQTTTKPQTKPSEVIVPEPTDIPMEQPTVTKEPIPDNEQTDITTPTATKSPANSTTKLKKGKTYYVKGFGYQLVNQKKSTVKVVGVKNKRVTKLTIANIVQIHGKKYKVVMVGKKAFAGLKKLKSVVLGKNISSIGEKAFYGCRRLKSITGKRKTKIGNKAFYNTKISKKMLVKLKS